MLRARAWALSAQAHLDALSGSPADRAWAEVMDAYIASFEGLDLSASVETGGADVR